VNPSVALPARLFGPAGERPADGGEGLWRPLYFLSFEVSVRLFGRHTEWYHLVNVAIHLANVALVCLVAVRLGASRMAGAFGAAVFAGIRRHRRGDLIRR
jgi:hypothetical protein